MCIHALQMQIKDEEETGKSTGTDSAANATVNKDTTQTVRSKLEIANF